MLLQRVATTWGGGRLSITKGDILRQRQERECCYDEVHCGSDDDSQSYF